MWSNRRQLGLYCCALLSTKYCHLDSMCDSQFFRFPIMVSYHHQGGWTSISGLLVNFVFPIPPSTHPLYSCTRTVFHGAFNTGTITFQYLSILTQVWQKTKTKRYIATDSWHNVSVAPIPSDLCQQVHWIY